MKNTTTVERKSERELVVTRTFNGPAHLVFAAWTQPELFKQWWAPQSFGLKIVSCEMDMRTGGGYRMLIAHPSAPEPMAFFGRYLEVTPPSRLVWTNDEGTTEGPVTTVSFQQNGDQTEVTLHDLYPSKEALDEAINSKSTSGFGETFDQLDQFLATTN